MLKKCDTCVYSIFKYTKGYRLSNIYCKKIKGTLSKSCYKNLKFCNFYKGENEKSTV